MILNFVLLDDDSKHNNILESSLKFACKEEGIDGRLLLKTTKADDVTAFVASNNDRAVFFLDIVLTNEHLPDRDSSSEVTGLDVSKIVTENSNLPNYIVYVSAYSEYGIASLHTHAFDFLIKPFKMEELRACLRAIVRDMNKRSAYSHWIEICGDKLQEEQILYVSSKGNYSFVYTLNGIRKYRITISELTDFLAPNGFKRIHRKYIVNQRNVSALWQKEGICILNDGTELPISKKYAG